MSACCGNNVFIQSGYRTLSHRLLDYGKEAYADVTSRQRVIMWVFIFYDDSTMCKMCKAAFDEMFSWFRKYGLFDNPVRCVRTVIEDDPEKNLIYTDLGMQKLPAIVFADDNGRIIDILFEFPEAKWLENYILPYIQADGGVI